MTTRYLVIPFCSSNLQLPTSIFQLPTQLLDSATVNRQLPTANNQAPSRNLCSCNFLPCCPCCCMQGQVCRRKAPLPPPPPRHRLHPFPSGHRPPPPRLLSAESVNFEFRAFVENAGMANEQNA